MKKLPDCARLYLLEHQMKKLPDVSKVEQNLEMTPQQSQ
jgi:hypothetical protein